MPYIITTSIDDPRQRLCGCGAHHNSCDLGNENRRAVATLEEARAAIKPTILSASPNHVWHLAESGGTLGPLLDGTVIEVEPISWARLRNATAMPHRIDHHVIDAYNAQHAHA